jgi:hypothetical protein
VRLRECVNGASTRRNPCEGARQAQDNFNKTPALREPIHEAGSRYFGHSNYANFELGTISIMSRIQRSPPTRHDIPHAVSDSDVPNLVDQEVMTPFITQRIKRPRESCCEDLLEKFKDEMKSMILDMSKNQNDSLAKLVKDVAEIKIQNSSIQKSNQEIEKSLQFLSDQFDSVSTRVEALEKERKEHLLHIASLETRVEDIQRTLKSSMVEIRNVPCPSKKESSADLTTIIQNTCGVLRVEVHANDIKDVYRIKGKSGTSTIVADFTRSTIKQEVIKSAKMYNKQHPNGRLNSNLIGLPGNPVPVYISESLTNKGRRLLYLARNFIASANYKYCWTSHGRVFVRRNDDTSHIEIKSEADLGKLQNQK